nr:MAG TPA: hypothetical protein [Caudoviricetes sp.]
MTTWISDNNGNRCSVEHFGSAEAAQKALDSLKDCRNCTNCTNCTNCSRCSDCSRCSYCSDCSRCSDCSDCSYCSGCKNEHHGESTVAPEAKGAPSVPVIKGIHTEVYKSASQPEALNMGTWHTCGTTHCRAGWVVTLAGEEGKKLESFFNTELAAMLIYRESGSPINPARFYDGESEALADMKRLADEEAVSEVKP